MFVSSWNYRRCKAVLQIPVAYMLGQKYWHGYELYYLLNQNRYSCEKWLGTCRRFKFLLQVCNVCTTSYTGHVHVKLEFCPVALIHKWVVCTRTIWCAPRNIRLDLSDLEIVRPRCISSSPCLIFGQNFQKRSLRIYVLHKSWGNISYYELYILFNSCWNLKAEMITDTHYFSLSCILLHILVNTAVSLVDKRIVCVLPNAGF